MDEEVDEQCKGVWWKRTLLMKKTGARLGMEHFKILYLLSKEDFFEYTVFCMNEVCALDQLLHIFRHCKLYLTIVYRSQWVFFGNFSILSIGIVW